MRTNAAPLPGFTCRNSVHRFGTTREAKGQPTFLSHRLSFAARFRSVCRSCVPPCRPSCQRCNAIAAWHFQVFSSACAHSASFGRHGVGPNVTVESRARFLRAMQAASHAACNTLLGSVGFHVPFVGTWGGWCCARPMPTRIATFPLRCVLHLGRLASMLDRWHPPHSAEEGVVCRAAGVGWDGGHPTVHVDPCCVLHASSLFRHVDGSAPFDPRCYARDTHLARAKEHRRARW